MHPFPVMLFAAGFGTRMGALTADRPKPLIPVAGRPLLDHALSLTQGLGPRVVNLHYRAEQIAAHLSGQNIALSWEREQILETGGGLRAALPLLGPGPVYTLNTDAVWTGANPLHQLSTSWDAARMSALLLLAPPSRALGHSGTGDFLLDDAGRLIRANGAPGLIYLGAQILCPDGLAEIPDRVFSLNRLWDSLISQGRAYGLVHLGRWCDVGRPEGIAMAEAMLAQQGDD